MAQYTPDNRFEIPDPVPVEKPLGFQAPPSLEEMIRRAVRVQVSQMASAQGAETFEEADDFDVDDDEPVLSPYQEALLIKAKADAPPGYLPDASETSRSVEKPAEVPNQPPAAKSAPAG